MDPAIFTIDDVQYDYTLLVSLSGQAPDIAVTLSELKVLGDNLKESLLGNLNEPLDPKLLENPNFLGTKMLVMKYYGKMVLISGYQKYLDAIKQGKEKVSAKLLSKPLVKKARFEQYEKVDITRLPDDSKRRGRERTHSHYHSEEDESTNKVSRERRARIPR